MLRVCTSCNIEKEIEFFVRQGNLYRYKCKECNNAARRTGKPNTGRFQKGHHGGKQFCKGQESIFKGRKHSEESIKKMQESLKGKIPWNKDKKWENPLRRKETKTGYFCKEWAKKVKDRDGNKCVECSSTYLLAAHHIKPWKGHPELRFDVDNGLSLCSKCHVKVAGFQKGHSLNNGKQKSEKTKRKISDSKKGSIPWNKGLQGMQKAWNKD